ncbi:hypothetical protein GH5_05235 [Leishmania sp. Ghana 2012 LV757]|uniref:hypothetical protein n=1 Tax=Leishmania sp. Ghana 2012 LV757 TaxID=2803181 RepID=UPI001B47B9D3|nr:hypothetical protein GH5_05235 [Leishmania sp. Ghana 2012 LV757]
MATRTASLETCGSVLAHSSDEGSIVECNVLDERVERVAPERYSPAPERRGDATAGGVGHGIAMVSNGAVSNPHVEAFDSRLPSKAQWPSSGAQQPLLMRLPPSQIHRRGGDFTDTGRDVGFSDSVDGFAMYVDEDGVMKMSKHRRGDPFAFGYDAAEEGDFSMDGGRVDSGGRRSSYRGGDGVARGSSCSSSDGFFVSGSSSYSSSFEEAYPPSQQTGDQVYDHRHPYVNGTSAAAGYECTPLEMYYRGLAGALATYDDDVAPVPINAALPSHHHTASRRRRLVGPGSNLRVAYHVNRGRPSRKKGKRARGGSTRGRKLRGGVSTVTTSPHVPVGRQGVHREVRSSGRRPTRLSCSGSLSLSTNPVVNIVGGGGGATAASAAVATSVPGGLSALLSASPPIDVRPSDSEKTARVREYLLARQAVVERRYAALRRRSSGTASTSEAAGSDRSPQKAAAADAQYATASPSTCDDGRNAAVSSDALAPQHSRGAWPSTPLSMSLNDLNRGIGFNTWRAGSGTALTPAATRTARLRAKDASTQLQPVVTKEEAVYVRADPTSAAAAPGARGNDGKGAPGSDSSPGVMHATALTAGVATRAAEHMTTLPEPDAGLTIAPTYAPLTKAASAVHTCAAGIHFFRDPTAPRPSEPRLQPVTFSAFTATPSPVSPAACRAGVGNAPSVPMHTEAANVSDEALVHAPSSASHVLITPCTAGSATAAYRQPASRTPAAPRPPPSKPSVSGLVCKGSLQLRSPRPLMMSGPSSATSLLANQRQCRDGVAPTGRAQLGWRTPTKEATLCDVRPGLEARGQGADAGALHTVPSSGNVGTSSLHKGNLRGEDQSTVTSIDVGDGARSQRRWQRDAAAPAAGADMEGGAGLVSWRWRGGTSAFGRSGEGTQGRVSVAAASKDEAARGRPGAWSAIVHSCNAAVEYDIDHPAVGASSSAPSSMPSSAWPRTAPPQPPSHPPPIAPYAVLRHPQQNTRYHAWTVEGVSATSSTSCVVHVFTVSRAMLRSVYEYVAYMCVARRYAEVQRRRRKREEHLIKELATSRLTREAQRCLRCPHCGVVGQVVRGSYSQRDSQVLPSNFLVSSTLAQSQHEHGAKHHHHSPHHSPASRHPSLASISTTATTNTTPRLPQNTPRPLLVLRGSASTASNSFDLSSSQQQHMERLGQPTVVSPSPRWTSLPPHPPSRPAFGMDSVTQCQSRAAVDDSSGKVEERPSVLRALAVDEVNAALAAPPESPVSLSSPAAPAVKAAHAPLTRSVSATLGSLTALPPLARSASLPPLRPPPQKQPHEEDCVSQEFQQCRSAPLSQLPSVGTALSPSPLPSPPPLLISAAATIAPPPLARLQASPNASGTQGTALAGPTRSSNARAEVLLDSSVVSGELSQSHYLSSSPYEASAPATFDRFTSASSSDFSAQRQQPPSTIVARAADEARSPDEPVAAASSRQAAEECGGATGEDAAVHRSSSRTTLANCSSHVRGLRAGGNSSDAESGRLGRVGAAAPQLPGSTASQRWPPPGECSAETGMASPSLPLAIPAAALLNRSALMVDTGTHNTTVARPTATAPPALAASADSSASRFAPPASTNAATTATTAVTTAFDAQGRAIGSSFRSNPNMNSRSDSNSLLCSMMGSTSTSAVPPLLRMSAPPQCEGGEGSEDKGAVMQRWRDTDSRETAREYSRSGGGLYVCLSCHQEVLPKPSLLTSVGDHRSSRHHSHLFYHHSADCHSPNINNISSRDGDADVSDVGTEDTVPADIGVMAFDDLLQDDAFVYALHASLRESLMMPSTREPPPLPLLPRERSRKRPAKTLPAHADPNDLLNPLLPVASVQLSPEAIDAAATDAAGKARSGTAVSAGAPSCLSSGELHHPSPVAMRGGDAVCSESIGGDIGDDQDKPPNQRCDLQQKQQRQHNPSTSPLSISAASSQASTSSTLASLESCAAAAYTTPSASKGGAAVAATKEGCGCSAAALPVRFSLPCCGLKVSVLPYVEPHEKCFDGGSTRRGSTERHPPRMRYSRSKSASSGCLPRRRASAPASLSRPAIPRMREDAATRGLTPSAMVMSDAAALHSLPIDRSSKQPRRLSGHRDTPPRQRRRRSVMNPTETKLNPSLASPSHGPMMHNAALWTALMMKGTFSSENHRIQVNPRTPLDAVSKNRIMQRIFRQERLGSLSDTTAVATRSPSRSRTAAGPSSRAENHAGGHPDALASAAAPAAASAAVVASDARRQRRASAADGRGGAAAAPVVSSSARGSDVQRQRCPHHHTHSYKHEHAQQHAYLLLPPKRSPKPLGLDLGVYRDPSLVLEIEVAYPRLHRGNVRELLTEWKDTCQPHPVLVEAVIRNIVYAVLVQLSALHAAGRTHGSVKSTNLFPLWHAMEGARKSGLIMPPRPRQRATSPSSLAGAHKKLEAGLAQEKVMETEAPKTEAKEDDERRWSASNVEKEGVTEPGGAPTAGLPANDEAVVVEEGHASTSVAAAVDKILKSPTRPRYHSGRRQRVPHAAAVHLRLHLQTRSHKCKEQSPSKAARGTGASSPAQSSASAALSGSSFASTAAAPSTGLATAMAAYRRRSVSVSVVGGTGADSKQDEANSILCAPMGQSPLSLVSSSPSTVLLSATMPPSALTSGSRASAVMTADAIQPSHTGGSSRNAAKFSPLIGVTSNSAPLRRRGGAAARLRRSSIGINVVGDGLCDLNDDAYSEDDSALVPLVAEVLAPPYADAIPRAAAAKRGAATAELGTAEPQTKSQNGLRETPTMNVMSSFASFAAVPRPRDHRHSHHLSPQGRGSCSAALEDPEEWLAAAAPLRYVRGVELRPPADVLFSRLVLGKTAFAGDRPILDHRGMPSADAAVVLESASDIAAQPVLTQGPVGAVPHPRLDNGSREETGVPSATDADQASRRSSPAGPPTSSSAALHAVSNGAGQDAPDPLQWSRQVLLVENVGAVVGTALRTAMTCVLMQRPPRQHASPLPSHSASLKSVKTSLSHSQKAHHTADAVASPITAAAATQGLRPAASQRMDVAASSARHTRRAGAAQALRVHVPDVVHSPPPRPPNLFAIRDSEYVPAPERIRFPVDEACVLQRLWCQQPGDAAAADEVKKEAGAGRCPELPHSPTITAADAGTKFASELRDILSRLEAAVSPAMTLRNTLDPYPVSSAAVDIWEVGMMALELADGPPPPAWLKQREPSPALRTYPWSSYFHAFVSLCLQRAPEQRGTAAELLQHPWFSVALVPQAPSALPPTCSRSGDVDWSQGAIGSGVTGVPVEARNVETTRQSGKAGRLAPVNSPALPLWSARLPGVMGIDCLTAEEKAEWENYDYTLLYASGAPPARPHTTTTAAATAAVASAAEEQLQSGSSHVRRESASMQEAQGTTASASAASAGMRSGRCATAAGAQHAGELSSLLGLGRGRARTSSLLHAAPTTAAAMSSQFSALAAPSAGGRAVVALSSAAAASATAASTNDELMTAMCAVDLAQSFAELIMEQWVQQQQQLVPSLAMAAGAYDGAVKGRQAMSLPSRNFFTAAAATSSQAGASSHLLSIVSPQRMTTGAVAAAPATSNALSRRSAPTVTGHGAASQPQSALAFPWSNCEEKMLPMWGGHSLAFSNSASQSGLMAVTPVISPRAVPSPSPSPPSELVGDVAVRVLSTDLHTLHAPLRDPRGVTTATAANALVSPWEERIMDEWGDAAGTHSQVQWKQAPSSAAHGTLQPWCDRSGRTASRNSPSLMYPTLPASTLWDGSVSGGGGGCSKLDWSHSDHNDGRSTRDDSSDGGWDRSGNSPHGGHHTRAASGVSSQSRTSSSTRSDSDSDSYCTADDRPLPARGGGLSDGREGGLFYVHSPNVGGEVPVPTQTPAHHNNDTFSKATTSLIVDASERGCIFKVVTPGQRAGGGDMAFEDPTIGGGATAVREGVPLSSPYEAAPKQQQRGGGSDCGAALRPSPSRPTRHLLIGTIATALARLSMMAHRPSDSEGSWDETTSSSSEGQDSTSCSDGSGCGALSPMERASAGELTPLEPRGKVACTQGYNDSRDASCCEESDEDDDGQSMSADVRCDELLRCLSALQRRCPAAVGLWCVRVLQQAMSHPQTAASAVRVLERIESLLPAELERSLRWFKRPSASPSPWRLPAPSATSDPLRASGAPRSEKAAATAGGGGVSSPSAVAAVSNVSYASGGTLSPAELDASPSSFQNYEMAKWAYALQQAFPRCT